MKIRKYLNTKAQGIVEYALLLAFVVGLGVGLQGVGIKDSVVSVFDNVATILAGESENKYLAGFSEWSKISLDKLVAQSNTARIEADMEGLANIASFFNSSGMNWEELTGTYNKEDGYLHNKYPSNLDLGSSETTEKSGSTILGYYAEDGSNLSKTFNSGVSDWMQLNYESAYDNSSARSSNSERYFFSNEMNTNSYGNDKEKQVRVAFTKDSSGNITGTKVWVVDTGNNKVVTATNDDGTETKYSVYVKKSN